MQKSFPANTFSFKKISRKHFFTQKKPIKQNEVMYEKDCIIELRQNKIKMQEYDVCRFAFDELRKWDKTLDPHFFKRQFNQLMSWHYYFRVSHGLGYNDDVVRLIKLHLLLMIRSYKDDFMVSQAHKANTFWSDHEIKVSWKVCEIESAIADTEWALKQNNITFGVLSNRDPHRVHFSVRSRMSIRM